MWGKRGHPPFLVWIQNTLSAIDYCQGICKMVWYINVRTSFQTTNVSNPNSIFWLIRIRDGVKKNPDYLVTSIKRVGRYLAEITIPWSPRNSDMSLGRWVSEEDVTISKQTFRAVLYLLRRPRGQKFRNMVIGHALLFFKPSLKC